MDQPTCHDAVGAAGDPVNELRRHLTQAAATANQLRSILAAVDDPRRLGR